MASYTLFFNPMSRALIAKWAFAEAGAEPELVMVDWGINFGTIPARDNLKAYQGRIQARTAYKDSTGSIPTG